MLAMLRAWWQLIKQHPFTAGFLVVFLLVLILFIFLAYRFAWDWTGFTTGESKITITNTSKGNYTATITQSSKTLWDWLQLLIIPLALAGVALLFNLATTHRDRQIALDKQRGALLQAYLDRMSELLLEKNLHETQPDDAVFDVVRVRTTTVLCQLDGWRVGYVFVFLRGTKLMSTPPESSFVSLTGADFRTVNWSQGYLTQADLSGVNLSGANLSRTDLRGASLAKANLTQVNLSEADMRGTDLSEAILIGADLSRAILKDANLQGANLSKVTLTGEQLKTARSLQGATMPDGSTHP